jgi:transcriptional regulator with XRE-family HTH domain
MSDDASIGQRVRSVRKRRGLTQSELATASGVSASLIRKLEQGTITDTRLETARNLAVALRVPTTTLITEPDREEPDAATTGQWESVTAALAGRAPEPADTEPTAEGVRGGVAAIRPVLARNRFSEVRPMLAALLRDADALDAASDSGRQARFRALNMAGWVLTQVRQWDTAWYTLDRADDAATAPLDRAAVAKTRIWLLLRQGDLAAARDTATGWADQIEPRFSRATTAELSLWGDLLLNVANAAIRDNRPGEADDALRLARAAGDRIGREVMSDPSTTRVFGPATVAFRRAETYVIDGKPEKALAVAAAIPARALPATDMGRLRHQLDVANAHAMLRHDTQAFSIMQQIRQTAPEWLVQQRYARDVLGRIVGRRRSLPPEIRELADFIALPY